MERYLLTFRCYGTWLPGDARGYVDRRHNKVGAAMAAPSLALRVWTARRLPQEVVTLEAVGIGVVEAAVAEACTGAGWRLHAVQARTNHVHVVVSSDALPGRMMTYLKARASRRLHQAGLLALASRGWARGGSVRYLPDQPSVDRACHYVLHGQGPTS
jgi:hypothetical protein